MGLGRSGTELARRFEIVLFPRWGPRFSASLRRCLAVLSRAGSHSGYAEGRAHASVSDLARCERDPGRRPICCPLARHAFAARRQRRQRAPENLAAGGEFHPGAGAPFDRKPTIGGPRPGNPMKSCMAKIAKAGHDDYVPPVC